MDSWQQRHIQALNSPRGFEVAITSLLRGFVDYAERHRSLYGSTIAFDGVLGPAWRDIGLSILTLLNGDCGRLDCGTIDRFVRDEFIKNGLTREGV
mgnify:CR=1 FL=1